MLKRFVLPSLAIVGLGGCAVREVGTNYVRTPFTTPEASAQDEPKTIFLTIDGTSNTLTARTNAGRLYSMVDTFSHDRNASPVVTYYAEGVGAGDFKLFALSMGVGMGTDIKRAYSFLTRSWKPGDRLFLNGFSRGAYAVRALNGLVYSAGIPDLSAHSAKKRREIVDDIFDAYKVSPPSGAELRDHALFRKQRIDSVFKRHGLAPPPERSSGLKAESHITVEAMTLWDTVAALGTPDGSENPLEGPDHYLLTACNVSHVFHALSLDDNRVYSFTPIFAGGPERLEPCGHVEGALNVKPDIDEVWFSGAHADVGGTYQYDRVLDGALPTASLNWMLENLASIDSGLMPGQFRVFEDRFSVVHDPESDGMSNRILYRQSRKPSVYAAHAYGATKPLRIHASALDRLEWLFALDDYAGRCSPSGRGSGVALLCAQELASHSLVPELIKRGCMVANDWGYALVEGRYVMRQDLDDEDVSKEICVIVEGRSSERTPETPQCKPDQGERHFTGYVYPGKLEEIDLTRGFERKEIRIPFPRCVPGPMID